MGSKSIKLVYTLEIMKMMQRIVVVVEVTIEGLVEVDRAAAVVDDETKYGWIIIRGDA